MILSNKRNWKQFLSVDDEKQINNMLKKISKYRGAYRNSDDVKLSQLWCGLLELNKEIIVLHKRIERIENLLHTMLGENIHNNRKNSEILRSLEKI